MDINVLYVVLECTRKSSARGAILLVYGLGKKRNTGYHILGMVFLWPGILVCSFDVCCTGMYGKTKGNWYHSLGAWARKEKGRIPVSCDWPGILV